MFVLLGYQMPGLLNICLVLSVPFALLLAFGRLAKDSEFKAAMAGGVRPLSLLLPLHCHVDRNPVARLQRVDQQLERLLRQRQAVLWPHRA